MCRLLGWAGVRPLTLADALGPPELAAFTALSRQHADGWGLTWWPDGTPDERSPSTQRSICCAAEDPRFAGLTAAIATDTGFSHLRWATPGLPVNAANTHPFIRGGWAFAHNGAIHPQGRLDELVPAGWERKAGGTTDSERYFLAIAARLELGETVHAAVAAVVYQIFENFQPTSLNAMLLAPDALYVVSAYDPAVVPKLNASSGGDSSSAAPDTVFYDLRYRRRKGSLVVASSGFLQPIGDGWEPLGNMELLRVERRTLATSVLPLGGPLHRQARTA